jgi:V/A-type H+-transporting ATPase subunit D
MAKIKLTKGELKYQRDSLSQFERYLPTLQLKKQQLQFEIIHQRALREEKLLFKQQKEKSALVWAGFLAEKNIDLKQFLKPEQVVVETKNIAGVDIPVLKSVSFSGAEYDLFLVPPWVDTAVSALRDIVSLRQEIAAIEKGIILLNQELRTTTQRVNLFEKIKIPEAKEAIRKIKIYIGDQMANAVGRCKIAKRKIELLAETVA